MIGLQSAGLSASPVAKDCYLVRVEHHAHRNAVEILAENVLHWVGFNCGIWSVVAH